MATRRRFGSGLLSWLIQAGLSKILPRLVSHHRLLPTGALEARLSAVKSGIANFFLYRGERTWMAFDAGVSGESAAEGLRDLGLSSDEIGRVFLTHSDWDHTGGLASFPEAEVFLPEGEIPLVDGRMARGTAYYSPPLSRPYTPLRSGETLVVDGVTVEAVAAAGHTPGSVAYRVDGRLLLTGDALRLIRGRAMPTSHIYNMLETAHLRESLRSLAALEGIEILCTAHTGLTRDFAYAMASWR